jgi:hypothetical protein
VWDFRYAPPDAVDHEYPISAIYRDTPRPPLGVLVTPGNYSVKLTVNGTSYTEPLIVKMDPRVKTSAEGMSQQFKLARRISELMQRSFEAAQKASGEKRETLEGLNRELGGLLAGIEGADVAPTAALVSAVNEIEQKLK